MVEQLPQRRVPSNPNLGSVEVVADWFSVTASPATSGPPPSAPGVSRTPDLQVRSLSLHGTAPALVGSIDLGPGDRREDGNGLAVPPHRDGAGGLEAQTLHSPPHLTRHENRGGVRLRELLQA